MSKDQTLRSVVSQRLAAAGEDVFGMFEGKLAELEEELSRSKELHASRQKLLDAIKPEVRIQRDVQQLLVVKEEVPPQQQQWSSSLKQEDPEPPHVTGEQEDPEPPHVTGEQEDPEPPHVTGEQEDPEPPHVTGEQEDPAPTR